jgi:hypothetical protein
MKSQRQRKEEAKEDLFNKLDKMSVNMLKRERIRITNAILKENPLTYTSKINASEPLKYIEKRIKQLKKDETKNSKSRD